MCKAMLQIALRYNNEQNKDPCPFRDNRSVGGDRQLAVNIMSKFYVTRWKVLWEKIRHRYDEQNNPNTRGYIWSSKIVKSNLWW